ncbi:hypothetical protein [Geodermatophilus marinus]|nr:hypothetical protein [Geodermatophilus sp. LHW52908]
MPDEAVPLTAATAGTAATWVGQVQFEWALGALLDSIARPPGA